MIYLRIDAKSPIRSKQSINVQKGLTNNFPDIVFELHDGCKYLDLGDNYYVSAAVTSTYNESDSFKGTIRVLNPHRGQIVVTPSFSDFKESGINTLTVLCDYGEGSISFQTTIFVQSIADSLKDCL